MNPILFWTAVTAAGLIVLVGIGWLFSVPGNKRRRQAAIDFEKIDGPTRAGILVMIDQHARAGVFRVLYLRSTAATPSSLARIGGQPLARAGEPWPTGEDGEPGKFLLQLPLPAVAGKAWEGRLIVVYMVQQALLVRSYSGAHLDELVPQTDPTSTAVEPVGLQAVAIPTAADDGHGADLNLAEQLIKEVPGLESKLAGLTAYPAPVLLKLLAGHAEAGDIRLEDVVLVGDAPALISSTHDPKCLICHQPMRFLFQLADATQSFGLGDCGVGYVYGCDTHPEFCQGFVDCY
ncbi:hypothetical protein [Pseudoxanthomonas sp. UTMC 1351]|uniref:hypothetical protein n=1 Tax=Pseudoxanthomonas sp. UTMC 1351 TaxID=2695853 RepID=UPI0034CF8376